MLRVVIHGRHPIRYSEDRYFEVRNSDNPLPKGGVRVTIGAPPPVATWNIFSEYRSTE